MRQIILSGLLLLSLHPGLASGAVSAPATRWADPASFRLPDLEKYRDYGAVVLRRERQILMFKAWGKDSYSEVVEHAALAVLDRSGHSHANVRVYYRSNWRIKDFAARTIDANGVVHEVTPDRIYDDAAINQSDKDDGLKVRVFAFPRVAEGSVLEYRYVLHLPYLRHLYWEYCVDDVPVIAYDLTLKISEDAICLLKIYNTRHDIQKSTEGVADHEKPRKPGRAGRSLSVGTTGMPSGSVRG